MNDEGGKPGDVAGEMDLVAWGYNPDDDIVSPLVKTEQFFREVPWDDPEDAAGPLRPA